MAKRLKSFSRVRGAGVPHQRTGSSSRAARAERQLRAFDLSLRGWTERAIATELGVSPATAHNYIARELESRIAPKVEQVRTLELARLDMLFTKAMEVLERAHWAYSHGKLLKTEDGVKVYDDGPVLQAIDRCIRIQERRTKYLGLDSPERVEAEVTTTIQNQELLEKIEAARDEMAKRETAMKAGKGDAK